VFLSFTPLGMWVVHAGLIKFTVRHWAASPDRSALLHEVLRAGVRKLPWLIVATLAAALAMNTTGFLQLWPALFISATFLSLSLLAQNALQAERSHWADFALSSAGSMSRSFVPPLLYVFMSGSLLSLQLGFCIHAAIFAAGCVYLYRKYKPGNSVPPTQLTSVYEGPLFIVLSLAGWLITAVNRWIIAAFFGTEKAGYFTLASNIALIVTTMLGVVFAQFFQPRIFATASEELMPRRQLARRVDLIAIAYCVLSLSGVITLRLLAPRLIGLLISENYRAALDMILAAGFFGTAIITAQFFHILLLAGHREKSCGPTDAATALILAGGGLASAFIDEHWFMLWLSVTPAVPWIVSRSLARYYYFKPALVATPSPAP
jgi:hypothetical protein